MRTLSVSVVCAALSRQIAFVVDDEMILIQMLVFREIWTRVKLDPGRVRAKPVTHDEVTDTAKEISARNFGALHLDRPRETALSRRATSVAPASRSGAAATRRKGL